MLLVLADRFLGDPTRTDNDNDNDNDLTHFPLKITGDNLSQPTNSDYDSFTKKGLQNIV